MKKWMMIGLLSSVGNTFLCAQEPSDKLRLSGSLQSDVLLPEKDKATGAEASNGRLLTNTYLDLKATSRYLRQGQGWSICSTLYRDMNPTSKAGACLMLI